MFARIDFNTPSILFEQRPSDFPALVNRIWKIYEPHHNMPRCDFEAKLATIDEIACFYHGHNFVGFSGIRDTTIRVQDKSIRAIYLGLSFIENEWRGKYLMQRLAFRLIRSHVIKRPTMPLYFWANCIGYRPYILITKHFSQYYPNELPTPSFEQELIDTLGYRYYGDNYNPQTGTVKKLAPRLKNHLADMSSQDRQNLYISRYLDKNPYYIDGHGILTLIPASCENVGVLLKNYYQKSMNRLVKHS